jgi:hypothetical protein
VQAIRIVLQGIDIRDPLLPVTEALGLRTVRAVTLVEHGLLSRRQGFAVAGEKQLLVTTTPPK